MSIPSTIYGLLVDDWSRCQHYHSELDIVALRCFACKRFYACFTCHNILESHRFEPWKETPNLFPVLCGACKHNLTRDQYQQTSNCPNCERPFNPNCRKHKSYYFA
ncbi:hypothetical protein SPOG_02747 [Schizosaccharomyces cryophilus OY26]|uniref:CHY-type domain-containing protein n=1 Tax=Schizosaccharomyces cryophilus (strain OY26 / ATCC MYA-4695 / CBS 11777 / NBRC 106824 / NRRL Y48691) TaxID=653667 RepID=S9W8B8_SCHCR|nr:uncharacterized protein SPOG_02747 [Schizosaccharomyces cryophilus OY26]EPY54030.1 hypothetical protein SPOG_02747 [Schizosaccharomyces cryophilus OY26]